ncbi:MAG TPA: nuclear transport factor 2 family protein [Planctomycetota bacterium]
MSRPRWLAVLPMIVVRLAAQDLPPPESWSKQSSGAPCIVQRPAGSEPSHFAPVVVLFPSPSDAPTAATAANTLGKALAQRGFVVVVPLLVGWPPAAGPDAELHWPLLFQALRRRVRIEQGGLHALVAGDEEKFVLFLLAHRQEFQTITLFGESAGEDDLEALRRLPSRRVHAIASSDVEQVAEHMQKLHAERYLPGAAGEVAKVLDDFHDAAAVGDERRYFAILPDDAVFLGTDGTERWTGAEFRKFSMPYFERDSAWTYVCLRRHVDVDAGGAFAWFDETFDNAAYGECRGSGVMTKRGDRWVLRQYHLTVPVPNDITRAVAARIRAFQDGAPLPVTTVVVVRHAETMEARVGHRLSPAGKSRAEALAMVLRGLQLGAVYTNGSQPTTETVEPFCLGKGLRPRSLSATETKRLVARIREEHRGQSLLVCGQSNNIPELLEQLGVTAKITIGDDEYDCLFVVTLTPDGTQFLTLRY